MTDDDLNPDATDDRAASGVAPWWYWVVAIGGLLFELAGVYAFYLQLTVDPGSLPIDQRALAALPPLTLAAYGIAVGSGVVGAIALLARWRLAGPALLVSLIAMAVQFGSALMSPALRGTTSSDSLLGPILLLLVGYGLWQFARIARRRGWIG